MPLYEYQCKKCNHRFEKIRKFSDKPIKKCPECGGAVEQVISAPAVQFKGSGWYVTDYANKPQSSSPASEGGKDSKKGEKSGEKSKSDGAAKSESSSESSSKETAKAGSSKKAEKK